VSTAPEEDGKVSEAPGSSGSKGPSSRQSASNPDSDSPFGVAVRPAATVMLVRETPSSAQNAEPYEIFMVRRSPRSEFVAGVYVFPGGAVEPSDAELERYCLDFDDAEASKRVGVESGGLAWMVAAARELFEEAGILLGRHRDGTPFDPRQEPGLAEQLSALRLQLARHETDFPSVLEATDLILDLRGLYWVAHWVTPKGQPRRYDTRFFLCELPSSQQPSHEGMELTDSIWIAPKRALELARRGEFPMIFPTIKNLEAIADFPDIGALMAWASTYRPSRVEPEVRIDSTGVSLSIPGREGTWRPDGSVVKDGGSGSHSSEEQDEASE
jgi:8-oxo-dGTP pyrophosphatase MutT (NUDIX family)